MMSKQLTINQLKAKLQDAWSRGKAHRIEIGTLLLALRNKAKHGEWGKLLAELGIPATTASDYMTEASREIHGIRVFDHGEYKDAEAEEMQQAVNAAAAEVDDATPPEPRATPAPTPAPPQPELDLHTRVKGPVLFCTSAQKDAYKTAKRENKERVYEIFYNAFLEVIGEQQDVRQEEVRDEALAA
jgi:hypothetical protein